RKRIARFARSAGADDHAASGPHHLLPTRGESAAVTSVRPVADGELELPTFREGASGTSWYRRVTSTASPGCNSVSSLATIRSGPFSPFLMMAMSGLLPAPRTSCDRTIAVY